MQQTLKEIQTRFDLKDSKSLIELNEKDHKIVLASQDEFKLRAVKELLEGKLVKRKVPLKGLTYGAIEPAAGSSVRQEVTLQQGIAIVLVFIGVKMLAEHWINQYIEKTTQVFISLGVILLCISGSIFYSIFINKQGLPQDYDDDSN